jgi:uncharacterized RDD family membrane protein YckC
VSDLTSPLESGSLPEDSGVPSASVRTAARRRARTDRIDAFQGRRAGFPSRALADMIDWLVILGILVFIILVVSVVVFLFTRDVRLVVWPTWLHLVAFWVISVSYFTNGWATTGKTVGKIAVGLRVLTRDGRRLPLRRAFGRALLCATFYPALAWVLFSSHNFGLEDLAVQSQVVYDWKDQPPPT